MNIKDIVLVYIGGINVKRLTFVNIPSFSIGMWMYNGHLKFLNYYTSMYTLNKGSNTLGTMQGWWCLRKGKLHFLQVLWHSYANMKNLSKSSVNMNCREHTTLELVSFFSSHRIDIHTYSFWRWNPLESPLKVDYLRWYRNEIFKLQRIQIFFCVVEQNSVK